jgi:hypothetical protein
MDAGKVKIVLNALREELDARRAAAGQTAAGSADDAPVLPASASGGAHLNREHQNANKRRERAQRAAAAINGPGVLVHLSDNAHAAANSSAGAPAPDLARTAELANRPIPEVVVPFRVSDEPLVPIAPYLAIAVLAAAAAAGVVVLVL